MVFDCDPIGTWKLSISSATSTEESCGQGDSQLDYIVERGADGALFATLPAMTDPTPQITIEQVAFDSGCAINLTMTASIVFMPDSNGDVDTVTAAYTYSLTETAGSISGTGTVHMTTITDKGVAKVDCLAPIAITGNFVPEQE